MSDMKPHEQPELAIRVAQWIAWSDRVTYTGLPKKFADGAAAYWSSLSDRHKCRWISLAEALIQGGAVLETADHRNAYFDGARPRRMPGQRAFSKSAKSEERVDLP